jgi:hypothetical protein
VIEADIREPDKILRHPDVLAHLNFGQPVALVMCVILHFVASEDDPAGIVAAFRDVMAPGSALVISHVVDDGDDSVSAGTRKGAEIYSQTTAPFFILRSREQVGAWFDGFSLVPPGLVDADAWRRAGNSKTTAPIVAGVGVLDPSPPSTEE